MNSLQLAVERALGQNLIGRPVAVRLTLRGTADPDQIDHQLAWASWLAARWLNSAVEQLHLVGDLHRGERTALVRFVDGQSALVSSGVRGAGANCLSALVIGTGGMISFESAEPFDGSTPRGGEWNSAPPAESPSDPADEIDSSVEWRPVTSSRPTTALSARRGTVEPPFGVLLVAGDHTHQPTYASAFAADPRCRLIAVTDDPDVTARRRELNERLAGRLGIPYLPRFGEAIARDDVQVVSICAEPIRRGKMIQAAAANGKHLYLDKPLCGARAELAGIVDAVTAAGVLTHMYSQIRWPVARRARELVESGTLGAMVAVHVDLCFAKGHAGAVAEIRPRQEQPIPDCFELPDAKREMTNIGVYGIAFLLWLLDDRPHSVTAVTGNYFFEEHRRRDMEDFGQILLDFEGEVSASVTAGRTGWQSHPADGVNRVQLLGTRGGATVDLDSPRAEVWSASTQWSPPRCNPDDPMGMWPLDQSSRYAPAAKSSWFRGVDATAGNDVDYFIDCLERGEPSEVSIQVAAAASEILFAAYQSAASRRTVRFLA